MHPSKFFKMAEILNCNGVPDRILKQKLENVHPLNFLNAQIKLPVYKVGIRYRTRRGNLKETEKYMLAGINPGGGGETDHEDIYKCMIGKSAEKYGTDHLLMDMEVVNINHLCNVALRID